MIPVILQPEPDDFDVNVRQRGHQWLADHGIALHTVPSDSASLPSYWRSYNKTLWEKYDGVCAYLAIYFEWPIGAHSTDHFVAKSQHAGMAYEWDNYRLSSLGANRNKNKYDDVLDPIGLAPDTFILNLTSGEISPNSHLAGQQLLDAQNTIKRLKLDSEECNQMRAKHYTRYLRKKDEETFKELSPFVWYEANRQGLL